MAKRGGKSISKGKSVVKCHPNAASIKPSKRFLTILAAMDKGEKKK